MREAACAGEENEEAVGCVGRTRANITHTNVSVDALVECNLITSSGREFKIGSTSVREAACAGEEDEMKTR